MIAAGTTATLNDISLCIPATAPSRLDRCRVINIDYVLKASWTLYVCAVVGVISKDFFATALYHFSTDVGDGEQGASAPPPTKSGKIFFGQLLYQSRAFFGQNHANFGNLLTVRANIKNSGILIIFHTYFSGKNVFPPKVD